MAVQKVYRKAITWLATNHMLIVVIEASCAMRWTVFSLLSHTDILLHVKASTITCKMVLK